MTRLKLYGLEGRCLQYIYLSLAYYQFDKGLTHDAIFDNICETLKHSYKKLPSWFTERVALGDLAAGTGYALEGTEEEREIVYKLITGDLELDLLTEQEYNNAVRKAYG